MASVEAFAAAQRGHAIGVAGEVRGGGEEVAQEVAGLAAVGEVEDQGDGVGQGVSDLAALGAEVALELEELGGDGGVVEEGECVVVAVEVEEGLNACEGGPGDVGIVGGHVGEEGIGAGVCANSPQGFSGEVGEVGGEARVIGDEGFEGGDGLGVAAVVEEGEGGESAGVRCGGEGGEGFIGGGVSTAFEVVEGLAFCVRGEGRFEGECSGELEERWRRGWGGWETVSATVGGSAQEGVELGQSLRALGWVGGVDGLGVGLTGEERQPEEEGGEALRRMGARGMHGWCEGSRSGTGLKPTRNARLFGSRSMEEFCSVQARAAGEGIAGSAVSEITRWVVLEVREPWADKAYVKWELPREVRGYLDGVLEVPGTRVQLIRSEARSAGPWVVYVASSEPGRMWLRRFEVEEVEELLEIDFRGLFLGEVAEGAEVEGPLYLVCTHGKRDRCCALYGRQLYLALSALGGDAVWQSSHLGGHRFAPTMLVLPQGLLYGWLEASEAEGVYKASESGLFYRTDRLRGRTAYAGPVQAAEIALVGEREGRCSVDAWRLQSVTQGSQLTRVRFVNAQSGERELEVSEEATGEVRSKSCGKAPEAAKRYRVQRGSAQASSSGSEAL